MGIRCSQPKGLSSQAEEFLYNNAAKDDQCPHCKRHNGYQREVIGTYGMFDELQLYRYTLLDGSTADEFIQAEIWSSGPMIWLALKWKDSNFVWCTQDIKE